MVSTSAAAIRGETLHETGEVSGFVWRVTRYFQFESLGNILCRNRSEFHLEMVGARFAIIVPVT